MIDIMDNFKYLGVNFSKTRSFFAARKHVLGQARKALHLLYEPIRHFNLPIDLQLKMFDHTVLSILLYGSEIWGFENIDPIEAFHNDFLRKISNMKKYAGLHIAWRIRSFPDFDKYQNAHARFLDFLDNRKS